MASSTCENAPNVAHCAMQHILHTATEVYRTSKDFIVTSVSWLNRKIIDLTHALPHPLSVFAEAAYRSLPYLAIAFCLPPLVRTIAIVGFAAYMTFSDQALTPNEKNILNGAGTFYLLNAGYGLIRGLIVQSSAMMIISAIDLVFSATLFKRSGLTHEMNLT